jgi:hypothetical protein
MSDPLRRLRLQAWLQLEGVARAAAWGAGADPAQVRDRLGAAAGLGAPPPDAALAPARAFAQGADAAAFPPGATPQPRSPAAAHPLQPGARWPLAPDGAIDLEPRVARLEARLRSLAAAAGPADGARGLVRLNLGLWRDQRALAALAAAVPGELVPADDGLIDHPAWSTARVAAAVAGLGPEVEADGGAEELVLLRVSLRGVQPYLAESRKARDLWTGSMIFGELVWAALEVVVGAWGPAAVLVPDLLGNPMLDQWLLREHPEVAGQVLPPAVQQRGAPTRAVPVPNTFTALVPAAAAGAQGRAVDALCAELERAVAARWAAMVKAAEAQIAAKVGVGAWAQIYARSTRAAPGLTWTAVPWRARLRGLGPPPANLPGLPGRPDDQPGDPVPGAVAARWAALGPFLSPGARAEQEQLFFAAWSTDPARLGQERGVDYALVTAQLEALHASTGAASPPPAEPPEPGDKCTLTGRHQALTDRPAAPGLGEQRAAAKAFAQRLLGADDSGAVSERLGGPAAMKRLLADAAGGAGIGQRWMGVGNPEGLGPGAPFPSTAGIAAAAWLARVAGGGSGLGGAAAAVVSAARAAGFGPTVHPLAHPALCAARARGGPVAELLGIEPELLHPSALRALRDRAAGGGDAELAERLNGLLGAVGELLRSASFGPPPTQVAVLAMDGDGVSSLVKGEPDALRTTWEHAWSPALLGALEAPGAGLSASLRHRPRALSPAMHATFTRALADFVDQIAPWVIEVEHHGRLIYAGGDDLLALLPAAELGSAAARLQQLYSAPWVIDTDPGASPWGDPDRARARLRFRVPTLASIAGAGPLQIEAPAGDIEDAEAPVDRQRLTAAGEGWRLFPMMGRAHSLSAGAAIAGYKEPLNDLIGAARDALELRAKVATRDRARGWHRGRAGAGAPPPSGHIAITRLTGGQKAAMVSPWCVLEDLGRASGKAGAIEERPPSFARAFRLVVDGFAEALAGRGPYQARPTLIRALSALDGPRPAGADDVDRLQRVVAGVARAELATGGAGPEVVRAVRALMQAGVGPALTAEGLSPAERADLILAPLLIARSLAAAGSADD